MPRTLSICALAGLALLAGCGGGPSEDAGPAATAVSMPVAPDPAAAARASAIRFTDVTSELGLDFVHHAGPQDGFPLPAIMAGGGAAFDYDGDGDVDLYFVDYALSDATGKATPAPNRLYRQEEDGTFRDVTERSGAGQVGFGLGCAVADADNDGDLDLFVSNYGADALLRNDGDGTFTDVSRRAGFVEPGFSTSAAFFDYDGDGLLDLWVARYVAYDESRVCTQEGGRRDYCGPAQFDGAPDRLYHNEGGLRFRAVQREAGVSGLADAGLGVVAADLDGDGWTDVYVANDADPNHLWINRGGTGFVEEGVLLGAALNDYGVAEAGMGIALGDEDGDGDLDLFVTHLIEETNTLYRNDLPGGFTDVTAPAGLALASVPYTGFGTAWLDADNDGDLDLAVVDGAVKRRPSPLTSAAGWWNDYAEPNLFFESEAGRFAELAPEGIGWSGVEVSRGLLLADLDRDGGLDLVVVNLDGPARIFRNTSSPRGGWVGVRTWDPALLREALGARITARTAERTLTAHALAPGGYLTAAPAEIHFGLGAETRVEGFEVTWPDGEREAFPGADSGSLVELRRGEGSPP